ncbi:hypothetical protein HDU76_001144 [Blyttiomyces sp. JEL0837]|nr:hypothetical protein HDU76_001144 [Blyttiomyces sp. JEL0837]
MAVWLTAIIVTLAFLGLVIQLWRSRRQSSQSAQLVSRNTSIIQPSTGLLKEPNFEPWDKTGRWALAAQIASYILLAYGTYLIASGIYTAIKTSDSTGVIGGIAQIMGGIATVFLWRSLLLPVRAVIDDMEVDVVDDLKKRREKQAQSVVSHVAVAAKDVGEAGNLVQDEVASAVAGVHQGAYVAVHPAHVGITIDPSSTTTSTSSPAAGHITSPQPAAHIGETATPIASTRRESMLSSPLSSSSSGGLSSGQQASAIAVGGAAAAVTAEGGVNPQLQTILPGGGAQQIQGGVTQSAVGGSGVSGTTATAATLGGTGSSILGTISSIAIAITIGSIAITTITTTIPGGVSPLGILPPTTANIESHYPQNQFTNNNNNNNNIDNCLCSDNCINSLRDLSTFVFAIPKSEITDSMFQCIGGVSNSDYTKQCLTQINSLNGSVSPATNFGTQQRSPFVLSNTASGIGNDLIANTSTGIPNLDPRASGRCSSTKYGCFVTVVVRTSVCYGYPQSAQAASACCVST